MTPLWNEPDDFVAEMTDGFVITHADVVRSSFGGVERATCGTDPEVAVVTGGGSGHFPAFAGLVGPGLAHGVAMGNVFASPSAHRIASIARTCDEGRGVVLIHGNYTGDMLNFSAARISLQAEGVDCRQVAVTDDVASAPPSEKDRRRGIAGDLIVLKVAGAAAAAGATIDDVEQTARKANERTRSLGVGFSGCTLPGATKPLFAVPPGKMAVGLGIHGEPGLETVDVPSARELAGIMVDALLADVARMPWRDDPVIPVLNGLGGLKYEALYLLYRDIDSRLRDAGLTPVDPAVGEFLTSFDMSGVSLTLTWADSELQGLWKEPAVSAGFRTSRTFSREVRPKHREDEARHESRSSHETGSLSSREAARSVRSALEAIKRAIDDSADELGRLDSVAGDGDHGIGMQRGSSAALTAARSTSDDAGAGTVLKIAGAAWSDEAGGTSGALWGVLLLSLAATLGDQRDVTGAAVASGVVTACDRVRNLGGAKPGDKTLIDALVPFSVSLAAGVASGASFTQAWRNAAQAARRGAQATAEMRPKLGRARTHGDSALGHPDPGAISFALAVEAIGDEFDRVD